jgi:transcriptional regulator with XRE-family HTH domain
VLVKRGQPLKDFSRAGVRYNPNQRAFVNALKIFFGDNQSKMAAALGVSRMQVYKWRRGEASPGPASRKNLEELTGKSIEEWASPTPDDSIYFGDGRRIARGHPDYDFLRRMLDLLWEKGEYGSSGNGGEGDV